MSENARLLRFSACLLLVAALSPHASRRLHAQAPAPLSAEEIAERTEKAEEAEHAPLFTSQEPIAVALRTDIKWLRDVRSDSVETEGTVAFGGVDAGALTVPVKVRARGNFRREKSTCNFPPLRLNFAGREVEGTVFEDQDKLKLVTPCQDSRDDYQQYIVEEYLVYKVYQLLTPLSFRVRLLEITYEDVNGAYETRTKTAFVLEDEEQMAERNRAQFVDYSQFHPSSTNAEQATLVAMFQFMIGNTDFSAPFFHNIEMVRTEDGDHTVVPYDFDFAGVVDARYAVPDERLNLRNVRQRIFRGYCRDGVDFAALKQRFNEQRDAIRALYEATPQLKPDNRERALEYYDSFYETLNNEGRFNREIVRGCLPLSE